MLLLRYERVHVPLTKLISTSSPNEKYSAVCPHRPPFTLVNAVANATLWNLRWPPRVFKYLLIAMEVLRAQLIVFAMQVWYAAATSPSLCLAHAWRDHISIAVSKFLKASWVTRNIPCTYPVSLDNDTRTNWSNTPRTRSSASSRSIKPVRDFLRQSQRDRTLLSWLSAGLVGNNNSSVIVVRLTGHFKSSRSNSNPSRANISTGGDSTLSILMGFLPLRLAFGEFCRKALCSEVRRCFKEGLCASGLTQEVWVYRVVLQDLLASHFTLILN